MKLYRFAARILPIALGLAVTLFYCWTQVSDFALLKSLQQRVESIAYDFRLNTSLKTAPQDTRIVIVSIDEKSLATEGRWPWPRSKIANLTDRLFDFGAVVVGYDIFFSEPERNNAEEILKQISSQPDKAALVEMLDQIKPEFDNDSRLASSLEDRDITLGYLFHEEDTPPVGELPSPLATLSAEQAQRSAVKRMPNYTGSLPQLQQTAISSGFVTTWPDPDGVIRRTPMVLRHGDKLYGSLSLNIAKLYLWLEDVEIHSSTIGEYDYVDAIQLGQTKIPTDGVGFTLVPFRGLAGSFPYISAADILDDEFETEQLEGAIVLIGSTAVGIADLVATPVENIYPGVEVHATMVRAILDNQFPTEPPWAEGANLIVLTVVGVVLAILLPVLSPVLLVAIGTLTAFGLTAANFWMWQEKGMALALAWPLMLIITLTSVNMAYGFLKESRKRHQLKNMFGQYIPPQLVDEMVHNAGEGYGFEGESREMTVLFADIRGFTTLSEKLSPSELRALLNRYFTHMTEIIFKHNGTIDKYVGDMIMAFWGAPLNDPDHAKHAIEAAMEMLKKTAELKPQLMAEGYPEVDIGIGLNTGLMNVGDMGSKFRRAYTVLGDNVNLGSRIEGLTKFYGAHLVVSETTMAGQDGYVFRRLDLVKVKGKTEAVKVFEPLCKTEKLDEALKQELEKHEQGLALYLQQNWDEAEQTFSELKQAHPEAHIYQLYLERINHLKKRDLGETWDGVYERREK